MKTYKVDLDYEAFLFDPSYREDSPAFQKIVREFEYVFFLVNQEACKLKNLRDYDKNYLNKLKNSGFIIPELNPKSENALYWWGHHHDYSLEQKLNSKITSAQLGEKNHWGFFEGALISSVEELRAHVKKFPEHTKWIIKRPHSFSGIGHYQFSSSTINPFILEKILLGQVLLEPVYERVFDIGTTFVIESGVIKRKFMVENFNSPQGGFKGGMGASDFSGFKKIIEKKYDYTLDELDLVTNSIADAYLAMGALFNIQIDSFVYREEGKLKLYPLVEVNYRKTMGLVIQALADKFSEASHIEWVIKTKKEIEEEGTFYQNHPEQIRLSPDGTHFQTYLRKIFAM